MEPANPDNEVTSDYADSSMSDSEYTSVTSSRLQYTYERGRRYQAFLRDRYGLPNDEGEQMREGFKHKLYLDYILDGRLFISPVGEHPQKVVDLGTGFGFWAQDVAERYPSARVIGADISPIQPSWSPPNIEFRVEDLEDQYRPWTSIYQDADLIHCRAFLPTVRHPETIIERSYSNLRPGGWIEFHDVDCLVVAEDGTPMDTHPLNLLYILLANGYATAYGWDLRIVTRIPAMLRKAGFVNVQVRHNLIPVGRWHADARMREMGVFSQTICLDLAVAVLGKYDILGIDEKEADTLFRDMSRSFDNPSIHASIDWVDVWAQKPPLGGSFGQTT